MATGAFPSEGSERRWKERNRERMERDGQWGGKGEGRKGGGGKDSIIIANSGLTIKTT